MANFLSRAQRNARPRGPLFWGVRLFSIAVMAIFLSAAGCEEQQNISPPSGEYPGTIAVTFDFAGADEIWYTLDGSEPTSKCLQYTEGDLILIDKATVVKARSVTYGADEPYSTVESVTYQIASDGGDSSADDSVNGLAINAWLEYESETRQIFSDKYFGGCEPVVGCGGGLDLGQMGKYYICDADSTITDPAACESAGGGWISWDVVQEGLGGGSTFVYSNYSYELSTGEILSATGAVVGHFDSSGTGNTNTSEGETIRISGAYHANIDDAVSVTERIKTGGSYFVSCEVEGCATGGLTYLVSAGPVVELLPATTASCDTGPAFIRIQQGGECLSPSNKGPFADLLACNSDLPEQQWDIVENTESEVAEDFVIQLKDGSGCLSAKPVDGGPFLYYEVAPCLGNDPTQTFSFAKTEGEVGKSARILASPDAFAGHSEALCLAPLSPAAKLITAYDCSDVTKNFDYSFVIGNTFPEETLDPTTDLVEPPAPVLPVNFDFTKLNGGYGIDSLDFTSGDVTVTATAINGQGLTWTTQGLGRGTGIFTYLMGGGEELNFTFDQAVDVEGIDLNSYGDATVTWTYSDGSTGSNTNVDAVEGGHVTALNLVDVTSIKVRANRNFVMVKGITGVTPTP